MRLKSERLRQMLSWVVIPVTVIAMLFAAGVHVGARRPDKPLARALLWAFGGEAGVSRGGAAVTGGTSATDGGWRIDEFEVFVDAPDVHVDSFTRQLGLVLRLAADHELQPAARVTIRATCGGTCKYAEYEDRLRSKLGEHEFEQNASSEAFPVDRVEWVQRPTELRSGVWWWRMQSFDDAGRLVADDASVAFLDPRATEFLHCQVEVKDPYLDRVEQLIEVCTNLEWQVVGADGPAMEARFGGNYEINALELAIPNPPAGFELDTYRPGRQVTFHGTGDARPSWFAINSRCYGQCDPATVREQALGQLREQLLEAAMPGEEYEIEHPIEELANNRWRSRVKHPRVVRGTVVAIRPGANDWLECGFSLSGSARDRGDEFEALCLAVLAEW
jgi:hypothetical protein